MQVDEWLDYAPTFGVGAEFEGACAYTNSYLALRTFLVGYNITIADVTVWAYLTGTLSAERHVFLYDFYIWGLEEIWCSRLSSNAVPGLIF